jgi:hypothetical protein
VLTLVLELLIVLVCVEPTPPVEFVVLVFPVTKVE